VGAEAERRDLSWWLSPEKRTCGILEAVDTSDDELYGGPGEQARFGTVPLRPTDAAIASPMLSLEAPAQSDEEIYAKYAGEMTRFATGLVGPSDAPDVVSAAVLSCMSSRQWPKVANPRAYLFRGVLAAAHQLHRSDSRRKMREERSAARDCLEPPEVRPEILAAVNALSVRQRAVTVLTYWFDLDPSSVARLLDISEG
jgi:DNA-directed RNA polymerase specialized sigma24 family protein